MEDVSEFIENFQATALHLMLDIIRVESDINFSV